MSKLFCVAPNDVWAAGAVLRHFAGTSWREVSAPAPLLGLNDVFVSQGRVFTAGTAGIILLR